MSLKSNKRGAEAIKKSFLADVTNNKDRVECKIITCYSVKGDHYSLVTVPGSFFSHTHSIQQIAQRGSVSIHHKHYRAILCFTLCYHKYVTEVKSDSVTVDRIVRDLFSAGL